MDKPGERNKKMLQSAEIIVDRPRRSDGVGRALRAAFRGRMEPLPAELSKLIERLN